MIGLPSITQQFRALFRPGVDSWFDADRVTIDGGTGKVSALVDYLDDTHALVQTTSANQCAAPAADGSVRGQRALSFAGSQLYISSRTSSAWKYLSDGSGGTIVGLWRFGSLTPAAAVLATNGSTSSTLGVFLGASAQLLLRVGTGSVLAQNYQVDTDTINARLHILQSSTAQWYASATGIAPSSGTPLAYTNNNPVTTLNLGARNNAPNSAPFSGIFAGAWAFRRYLTAAERAIVSAYTRAKYGVAA